MSVTRVAINLCVNRSFAVILQRTLKVCAVFVVLVCLRLFVSVVMDNLQYFPLLKLLDISLFGSFLPSNALCPSHFFSIVSRPSVCP